jgi:hypothetical protein
VHLEARRPTQRVVARTVDAQPDLVVRRMDPDGRDRAPQRRRLFVCVQNDDIVDEEMVPIASDHATPPLFASEASSLRAAR